MIVCHCTGTSDRKIRQEIESGASSCAEIGQRCAAGTICRGCAPLLERMVEGRDPLGAGQHATVEAG